VTFEQTTLDFTIGFCHKDTSSENFSGWNVDSSQFDGYQASPDIGAGRASFVGVVLGEYSGTLTTGYPESPVTGGNHGMFISGSATLSVKNNSGIWKL
jgi:hypothetical protein